MTDASTRIFRANREPKSDSLPQTPGIIASKIDREPEQDSFSQTPGRKSSRVNCEPGQDSFHQAPGSVLYCRELAQDLLPQASDHNIISPSRRSLSSAGQEKTYPSRSVTPMEQEVSSNRSLPGQYNSSQGRNRSKRIELVPPVPRLVMRLVPLEKGLDARNTNIVGLGTGPSPHCLGLGVMVMSDGIGILGLCPLDVDLGLLGPGTSLGLEADTTTGLGADTSLG